MNDFSNTISFLYKKITVLSTNSIYYALLKLNFNLLLIIFLNNWICKHVRMSLSIIGWGGNRGALGFVFCCSLWDTSICTGWEAFPGGCRHDSTTEHRMSVAVPPLFLFYSFRLQMLLPTILAKWLFISNRSLCVEGMDLPSPTLMAVLLLPYVFWKL